ncbi:unnamed protein product, partial [Prorocentrum cordatum]
MAEPRRSAAHGNEPEGRGEYTSAQGRRWLRSQARREEQMAAKGAAKVQLLRTELELGHE